MVRVVWLMWAACVVWVAGWVALDVLVGSVVG